MSADFATSGVVSGTLSFPVGLRINTDNACAATDHKCVDGLSCTVVHGVYTCSNSNLDDNGSTVVAFKATNRCVSPDLDHSWVGTHHEMNFANPGRSRKGRSGIAQVSGISTVCAED